MSKADFIIGKKTIYIEKNKPESYKYLNRQMHDNSFVNEKAIAQNKEEFKNR